MVNADQLRKYTADVLSQFSMRIAVSLHSADAVELLMLTAAQETHLGGYLEQVGGPALGMFQIEPATHKDLVDNYLLYKTNISDEVDRWVIKPLNYNDNLKGNLPYQIIVARLIYYRVAERIPDRDNLIAMAGYYKKYWNTVKGKATVEEAIANYKRYVLKGKEGGK